MAKYNQEENFNCHQRPTLWRNCNTLRSLKQIHASLIINGFNSCHLSLRELIYTAAIVLPGAILYAHQLFDQISQPDTFMWNTMLRGSAQSKTPSKALYLYNQMDNRQRKPDTFTFAFLLKACTRLSWRNIGLGIHGRVTRYGFESTTFVRNTLIYFHANCGDLSVATLLFDDSAQRQIVPWSALTAGYARRGKLSVARKLFDEMPVKDLVSWNVMITGYTKQGEMESARELFDMVPKRDVVSWNAMIAGYVTSGSCELAFQMFDEMRRVGEKPDEVTMLSLLSACTDLGDLEVGTKIHCAILEICSGGLRTFLGNALIAMYAKCGSINRAMEVFNSMKEKDISTWNSTIGGLAFHGHCEESINIFSKMPKSKIRPNEITFVGVLVACSHAGKVEEGRRYFKLMRDGYNVDPNIKHYGCMVDMLGRAGLLNEAFELIDSMEIKPNAIIWRTLLGACKIHGNVELGKRANERLLSMRMDESGDYVLLSNIYASRAEWDGVERVRKLMDDTGVKKEAGFSLVEAEDEALMHFLFDLKPKRISRSHGS